MTMNTPSFPPRTYVPIIDVATRFSLPTRTAVLLHPRKRHVADRFACKIGGMFAVPQADQWPHCTSHNTPHIPILQLTKEDISELPFPAGKDLFQLFWCPEDHDEEEDNGPRLHVSWRSIDVLKNLPLVDTPPLPPQPYYTETHIPNECALFPERVLECDRHQTTASEETISEWLVEHAQSDIQAMRVPTECYDDVYGALFSAACGTKVGGFPSFVQDPFYSHCACGKPMRMILTVSSDDNGDGGNWWRWAPSDVRDEQGNMIPFHGRGTDLCLGDMGNVHLFMCMECEGFPLRSVFQCS